jgi:multiple sugar transport system ATP-binding protein
MASILLEDVCVEYGPPGLFGSRKSDRSAQPKKQEVLPAKPSGGVMALDHINVQVPNGRTFVVVGPSGCGKTTLLRVVAGLERNYTGTVYFDGVDMKRIPPRERYIGMVFQNYALYPHLVSKGNLRFFFKMHKIDDAETEERIRATSELMGIGFKELLPRRPGTLSGGQRQRVAIARALVRAPRLFLLDEPLANLDAKLRVQTRGELKKLLHQFDITAIYVTHDQVEAVALADELVVMRAGKVEQVGTYNELILRPVNLFVAGFIGLPPMSLLGGWHVLGSELQTDGMRFPLPAETRKRVSDGQALTVGFRPNGARLIMGETAPTGPVLKGQVDVLQPDFSRHEQLVYLRTGSWSYACEVSMDVSFNLGDEVAIELLPDQLYFFDTKSGRRIAR